MDPLETAVPDLPEDHPSLGPAMRKLQPMQRRFVLALQMIGPAKGHYKRAAIIAGYKDHTGNAASAGWRLAHSSDVQAAMLEEATKGGNAAASSLMAAILTDIAMNSNKDGMRLKAALALGDRFGMPAITEQRMTVTHEVGPQAVMLAQLKAILRVNPKYIEHIPPQVRAMLEPPKEKPMDVEFAEIKDPDAELLGE